MANKLYEENSIKAIADTIRQLASNKNRTYTVGQMPNAIVNACQYQYENGQAAGFGEGKAYVKTTEARTGANITECVDVDSRSVDVDIESGYYATGVIRTIDVQPVYDAGYNEGYNDGHSDGYDDGLAGGGGGGGGSTDVDEMMLLEDYHENWEGEPPFYSYYKYLYYETSNLSSDPVVVSLENGNESKYLHVYIYAFLNGSVVGGNDEEAFYTVVLPPADEAHDWYSFDSLEINSPCFEVRVWGIRWSDDGV